LQGEKMRRSAIKIFILKLNPFRRTSKESKFFYHCCEEYYILKQPGDAKISVFPKENLLFM